MTPFCPSQAASSNISEGLRDRYEPLNLGIAQNVQRRSQPDASFKGAVGLLSSLNLFKGCSIFFSLRAVGEIGRSNLRS